MIRNLSIIVVLVFSGVLASASLALDTTKKSWLELAPSHEVFEEGAITILVSLSDYIDFNVSELQTKDTNLQVNLQAQRCVDWNNSLKLSLTCLNYLKNKHSDAFDYLILEFLSFYDLETPSYDVKIEAKDYPFLTNNFVLKRLKSVIKTEEVSINPVDLLNPAVSKALWTVPLNEANCFGTAYGAVTPGSSLGYRDYLWSNTSPKGYNRFDIEDPLVFGDLIEFEIPGDGHATVYLGTDQDNDIIVLTKNGYMPSVVQVMKYKDVYKLYEVYQITKVNVWRPDPNSSSGFAGSKTYIDPTDLSAMINTRKNAVQISVDEALAQQTARKFSEWMSKTKQ